MAVTEDRRTYTIYEIQDILRIGRSTAYRLVHTGEFRSVRVGG
ncbi:helix-turn-helix transcriptional regulator [Bilifractor sp. LCP19S3_H10]